MLEHALLPRNNIESPSSLCLSVDVGQMGNLDFYLHLAGKAVLARLPTGEVLDKTN